MSKVSPTTPTVKFPLVNFWVHCCWWKSLEFHLHGVHFHSHMHQFFYERWVVSSKDCIILCQSLKFVNLRLHFLDYIIQVVYRLGMLFWSRWWYRVDVLYHHCVSPFDCCDDCSPLFTVGLVGKFLECRPYLEVGGLSSPLSGAIVKGVCMCLKGDTFGHHYRIGNRLPSCTRKFFPIVKLLNHLV